MGSPKYRGPLQPDGSRTLGQKSTNDSDLKREIEHLKNLIGNKLKSPEDQKKAAKTLELLFSKDITKKK
jgi:hypothetical protein